MAISTTNPATGEVLKTFESLTDQQVDAKIQLASETFAKFRALTFAERGVHTLKGVPSEWRLFQAIVD